MGGPRPPSALREHSPLLVALGLYLLGVLAVRPLADRPLNDDWVYALDVVRSLRGGGLRFLGVESAWGIPQVWLGTLLRPEGRVHLQLRLVSVAAAVLSLAALHLLLRRTTANRPLALLLLAGVAVYPPFFLPSLTFMTDSLFLLLVIVACLLLGRAGNTGSPAWLLAAAAACVVAGLQRQFGMLFALPLAAVAFADPRKGRAFRAAGLLGAAAMVVAYAAATRWWDAHTGLPLRPPLLRPPHLSTQVYIAHLLVYFSGLLVVPAFFSLRRPAAAPGAAAGRGLRLARYALLALLAAEALYRLVRDPNAPLAGNLFSSFGVFREGNVLAGARETVLTLPLRVLATAVGFAPWAMLLLWLRPRVEVGRLRSFAAQRPHAFAAIAFGALYAAQLAARATFFDRYALPLVPGLVCAAALLLEQVRFGRRAAVGLCAAAALLAYTATTSRDYFSWNAAAWTLAGRAAQRVPSPDELDGGYEWNGWNGKIETAPPHLAAAKARHLLSFSPLPGTRIVDVEPWRSLWPPRERRILLLEKLP